MKILNDTQKEEFLETLTALDKMVPVMDMDDRDFTASVLYRMAKIVRNHGPNHGVSLNSPVIDEMSFLSKPLRLGDFHFTPSGTGFTMSKGAAKPPKIEIDLRDGVKKVIYNPPATIIYWADGTKTVVKCSDHDIAAGRMDPETGIVYALAKRLLGNKGNFNDVLRRLVKSAKKS